MKKIATYTVCGVTGLALLFNALSESDADIARKPHLVDQVVSVSMQKCDLQKNFKQSASYQDRLEEVLMDTRSEALDFVVNNDITVCLDHRMSDADSGFFDQTVHGLYFPKEKTLSLYDSGNDEAHAGWLETAAISYGGDLIEKFADEYGQGELTKLHKTQFGYHYSTGKTSGERWKNDAADYNVIQKNPQLLTPPLR